VFLWWTVQAEWVLAALSAHHVFLWWTVQAEWVLAALSAQHVFLWWTVQAEWVQQVRGSVQPSVQFIL